MFTREIMLLPVDKSYYMPLVCFVTVVYNLATQSIRGNLYPFVPPSEDYRTQAIPIYCTGVLYSSDPPDDASDDASDGVRGSSKNLGEELEREGVILTIV